MITLQINSSKIFVTLSKNKQENSRGLMGVDSLDHDKGMLFPNFEKKPMSFWMKNTKIPLSIAFIDKNNKILQINDLKPYDLTSVVSPEQTKWALEVNKGWFSKENIKKGDTIQGLPSKSVKIRVLKVK